MATFVILYKFTEQGVRNIKDSPKRTEAAVKGGGESRNDDQGDALAARRV